MSVFSRRLRCSGVRSISALLLGGTLLVGVGGLAGCGSRGAADPLAAASVDGHAITVADYQMMTAVFKASAEAQGQGQGGSWQTPAGRTALKSVEQSTIDYLVNLQLMRDLIARQHLSVSSQVRGQVLKSFDSQLAQVRSTVKQNPSSPQKALVQALTPPAVALLEEQAVDQQTLIASAKVPTVQAQAIPAKSLADAQNIERQAQGGADFGTLAQKYSTDPTLGSQKGNLGTAYIGQYGQQFDTAAFGPHPTQYTIATFGSQYVLFKIGARSEQAISTINDPTNEQTVFQSWLTTVVRPAAKVSTYVTLG